MALFFVFQHIGICILWLMLCLSEIVGLPDTNETRNGSLPGLLSDQASHDDDSKVGCDDWEGKLVKDGEKFVPNKDDMCMQCTCAGRFAILCHSVACSPPMDCNNVKLVPGACCEYECLDDINRNFTVDDPSSENTESITNLSLRLIASTVTSLLFLALLLFMVHRLRQRRMLMAMRRFQARSDVCISDDMDGDCPIPENFMSLECPPYTDPPPPYSPPKPPHILPGEQPPAYDEISIAENVSREPRSRNSEEGMINPRETRLVRETSPVIARLRDELSQSNSFHQIYSSPQTPSFGVVMEMPRSPTAQPQDNATTTNANQNGNNSILPAYASTDILFRNATFSTMVTPPHQHADANDTVTNLPNTESSRGNTSGAEAAGMPTLTAFQRFSSLFKRDKSKYKNRSAQQRRPVSEFVPPHYATLSRTHQTLAVVNPDDDQPVTTDSRVSNVTYRNNGSRNNGSSRARSSYPNLSLTDRMRMSYDSARAAYELAALSPSTSSNSSISVEQLPIQEASITTSRVPQSTTYSTDVLPSSQSATFHSKENVPPALHQQRGNSINNSYSCDVNSINHPSNQSRSVGSNISPIPHRTSSADANASSSHFHHSSPSKCFNDNTRRSPLSLNSFAKCNTPPSTRPYFNRKSDFVDLEDHNSRVNNLDGNNHRSRIRTFNPGANRNSPVLVHEPLRRESPPVIDEARVHSGAFPPSPLPALGQMRRSHSATSQASAFSVCSETGEKKLKTDKHESDSLDRPLASDCQYPPHLTCSSHSYSKSLNNPTPHSNAPLFRGSPNLPQVKRNPASNPVTSTLDPDFQPATLVIPMTSHLSRTSENPVSSQSKHYRQKDLHIDIQVQEYGDDNLSSTAVQSSPVSPPFVTVQSGKLISNPPPPAPAIEWTASRDIDDQPGRIGHDNIDEGKRYRKKIEKDRRVSSLSSKSKDAVGSPSHSFKDVLKTKYDSGNVRTKYPKTTSSKGVSNRKLDKKRLQRFQMSSDAIDNSILPDFEDFSASYGNADVYHSQVGDPSTMTSSFPVLSSPFHKFVESHADTVQLSMDHVQQDGKRSHPFSPKAPLPDLGISAHTNPPPPPPPSSRHLQQPGLGPVKYPSPQSRKKSGHKRLTSSGNRNSGTAVQKHNRSKSLTAAGRVQETDPVAIDTAFEQVVSDGRWVKSGFGHDLAFDDQSGVIDMDLSDKIMDQHHLHNPNVKMIRADTNMSKNFDIGHSTHIPESKVATASVVPLNTRRRSGLSQDLSFVNRSEAHPPNPPTTTKRFNKRGSLPGFLTFATQQQSQKSSSCDTSDPYVGAEHYHRPQETEMPQQKPLKNSKERRDRSNCQDKNGRFTATSYV